MHISKDKTESGRPESAPAWHVRATLLPFGDQPTDVYVVGGRITFAPPPESRELAPPGGFVCAGLVDSHTHIHFVGDPAAPHGRKVVDENRRQHLRLGTLLLRDMGASSDDVLNLPDDDGLPIVQAAGQGLLVESRYPFFVTQAKELPSAVEAQARAGAQWVKVFADWPGWPGKEEEPNFGGDDRLTYPQETLADAVAAARTAGVRVAIHAFARHAAAAGVAAGVDSIEHGWGLDEPLLAEMAAKGIAWTPMVAIAAPMLEGATRSGNSSQAAWIRESEERLHRTIPFAHRIGVPILAGSDWFPAVTLADEITQLHAFGLTADVALAAATSAARAFLRSPDLAEGAPADLVLYRSDPRVDLRQLRQPEHIMLRGVPVVVDG